MHIHDSCNSTQPARSLIYPHNTVAIQETSKLAIQAVVCITSYYNTASVTQEHQLSFVLYPCDSQANADHFQMTSISSFSVM